MSDTKEKNRKEPDEGSRNTAWRRNSGFTLVELIVVICVLAILTGAVTIGIGNINGDTRLSNAASRALSDVRYAQEMAMAHRRETDVLVYPNSEKYELKWHDDGSYLTSPYNGGNAVTQFAQGDFSDVAITSSQISGRLSFTASGEPLINGASFSSEKSVMFLNSRIHVVIYSSGYSCLEETVGGGGCGC